MFIRFALLKNVCTVIRVLSSSLPSESHSSVTDTDEVKLDINRALSYEGTRLGTAGYKER